jgi:hypothetical protein
MLRLKMKKKKKKKFFSQSLLPRLVTGLDVLAKLEELDWVSVKLSTYSFIILYKCLNVMRFI